VYKLIINPRSQTMELAVKTILGAVSLVFLMAVGHQAEAASPVNTESNVTVSEVGTYQVAEGEYAISEGQAADIAQATQPEAKVIKVKLLPSGVYAVTLKEGGNVTRVMVDANSGAIM
jgi:uncharacterized membrane protein YkoI